ncbi:MAG TPA: hypothetical protein VFA26_12595 [Gemmataceae bacterium]|nr:hypothetical protein [Gemmataceae bacterium]
MREAAERRRAGANFRQAIEEITALLDRASDSGLTGPPEDDQICQDLAERAMKFIPGLLAENRPDPDGRLLTGLAYLAPGKVQGERIEKSLGGQALGEFARKTKGVRSTLVNSDTSMSLSDTWPSTRCFLKVTEEGVIV